MKKLLTFVLIGLSFMGFSQNPVRDLKAKVTNNRFVNLSWEAPMTDDVPSTSSANSSYELYKTYTLANTPFFYKSDMYEIGGAVDRDSLKIYTLDKEGVRKDSLYLVNIGEDTIVDGSTVMGNFTFDGTYIYSSVRLNKTRNDYVTRFDMENHTIEVLYQNNEVSDMEYLSSLDNGKGGFVGVYREKIYFWNMKGDTVDPSERITFNLDSVTSDKNKMSGIVFRDGIFYMLFGNNKTGTIYEFDETGEYLGKKFSLASLVASELYAVPQALDFYTDPSTKNVYISARYSTVDPKTYKYISKAFLFEIEKNITVSGYNVYLDGTKLNEEILVKTTFADTLTAPGNYTYEVKAVYGEGEGSVESAAETTTVKIEDYGTCTKTENLEVISINKNNAFVSWDRPLTEGRTVLHYNVYRNGEFFTTSAYERFIDTNMANGEYKYAIEAVYDNYCIAEKTAEVAVTIDGQMPKNAPGNVRAEVYVKPNGKAAVDFGWELTTSREISLQYSGMNETGGYVHSKARGVGIKYNKAQLKHLGGYGVDQISFIPALSGEFTVMMFAESEKQAVKKVNVPDSMINKVVTVDLDNIVPVNTSKDLLFAVTVTYAEENAGKMAFTADKRPIISKNAAQACPFGTDSYVNWYYVDEEGQCNVNVAAHLVAIANSSIEDANFDGFQIYRDGEALSGAKTSGFAFTDTTMAIGEHTYEIVTCWKDGSDDLKSNPVKVNVIGFFGAPENFDYLQEENIVNLSWEAPLTGVPIKKSWAKGKNGGKIGLGDGGLTYVSALWTKEDLQNMNDYSITNIEIFLTEFTDVTFYIWQGGEVVFSKYVARQQLKFEEYFTLPIDESVKIDATKDLRVGYSCSYSENARPIGVDMSTSSSGKGNQLSLDGKVWESASELGVKNNFSIAFGIEYVDVVTVKSAMVHNQELAANTADLSAIRLESEELPVVVSKKSNNDFVGYNLYKNNEKINAEPMAGLAYRDSLTSTDKYTYKVGAVYTESEEKFTPVITVKGINTGVGNESLAKAQKQIYPNPAVDYIYVDFEYETYKIYNMGAQVVQESATYTREINVSGLATGNYIIIFTYGDEMMWSKLNKVR